MNQNQNQGICKSYSKHIIVRQCILIKPLRSLHVVFSSCCSQSKEGLNKPNLLQLKLGKSARNIRRSFRQLLPATCDATLRRVNQMRQKIFAESQRKSKQHQGKSKTKSKSQSKQTFLQLNKVNAKEQVVSSFLVADIPLHKLNFFKVYVCYNRKSIAFGDCSPDMSC